MNNLQDHIPKSLNISDILGNLKKILWVFIVIFIAFNIALFYFLNGIVYFVTLIIGNVVFVWVCIPVMLWIGKSVLVDRGMEAVDEVKQKFNGNETSGVDEEKIVKTVKKQN